MKLRGLNQQLLWMEGVDSLIKWNTEWKIVSAFELKFVVVVELLLPSTSMSYAILQKESGVSLSLVISTFLGSQHAWCDAPGIM